MINKRIVAALGVATLTAVCNPLATAAASVTSQASVRFKPDRAAHDASLFIHAENQNADGTTPPKARELGLTLPRETKINKEVVARLCNVSALERTNDCPSSSYVGSGKANIAINAGGFGTVAADLTIYRVRPWEQGDVFGAIIHAFEKSTYTIENLRARVVRENGVLEFLLPEFNLRPVYDVQPIILSGDFTLDARRRIVTTTGRRGRKKTATHVTRLLTTPPRCGNWSSTAHATFDGGETLAYDVPVPCSR